MLVPHLLFLWPVPGKAVTVTLEMQAPEAPGKYESYWRMEGREECEFWVKFEVSNIAPPAANINKQSDDEIDSETESCSSGIQFGAQPSQQQRKKKVKKTARTAMNMNLSLPIDSPSRTARKSHSMDHSRYILPLSARMHEEKRECPIQTGSQTTRLSPDDEEFDLESVPQRASFKRTSSQGTNPLGKKIRPKRSFPLDLENADLFLTPTRTGSVVSSSDSISTISYDPQDEQLRFIKPDSLRTASNNSNHSSDSKKENIITVSEIVNYSVNDTFLPPSPLPSSTAPRKNVVDSIRTRSTRAESMDTQTEKSKGKLQSVSSNSVSTKKGSFTKVPKPCLSHLVKSEGLRTVASETGRPYAYSTSTNPFTTPALIPPADITASVSIVSEDLRSPELRATLAKQASQQSSRSGQLTPMPSSTMAMTHSDPSSVVTTKVRAMAARYDSADDAKQSEAAASDLSLRRKRRSGSHSRNRVSKDVKDTTTNPSATAALANATNNNNNSNNSVDKSIATTSDTLNNTQSNIVSNGDATSNGTTTPHTAPVVGYLRSDNTPISAISLLARWQESIKSNEDSDSLISSSEVELPSQPATTAGLNLPTSTSSNPSLNSSTGSGDSSPTSALVAKLNSSSGSLDLSVANRDINNNNTTTPNSTNSKQQSSHQASSNNNSNNSSASGQRRAVPTLRSLQSESRAISSLRIPRSSLDIRNLPSARGPSSNLVHSSHPQYYQTKDSLNALYESARKLEVNFAFIQKTAPKQDSLLNAMQECMAKLELLYPSMRQVATEIDVIIQRIEGNRNIGNLGDDMWIKIFSYLSIPDLLSVSLVCRDWKRLFEYDAVWLTRYQNLKPFSNTLSPVVVDKSMKELYRIDSEYSKFYTGKWKQKESSALEAFSFSWPVYDLEIAGDTLVTVSDCLRVFDLGRDIVRATLPGHTKVVNSVKLAKTGRSCVTGSVDKTVKFWSLNENACLYTLDAHNGPITSVHQTGDVLISSCVQDKTVKIWNRINGQCVHTEKMSHGVSCMVLNNTAANDNYIYFGKTNGEVCVWDVEAQQQILCHSVATGLIEGFQVFDKMFVVADKNRMLIKDIYSNEMIACSPDMKRNVGRLRCDGARLGAQIGNRLEMYDTRFLFDRSSFLTTDNLWKGAFQFYRDSVIIGGGNGKTQRWHPI